MVSTSKITLDSCRCHVYVMCMALSAWRCLQPCNPLLVNVPLLTEPVRQAQRQPIGQVDASSGLQAATAAMNSMIN